MALRDLFLERSASVALPSGKAILLEAYATDPDDGGNSFLLYAGRLDSEEGWKGLEDSLDGEPAGKFLVSDLGIPFDLGMRNRRAWTNLYAKTWLGRKLSRAVSGEEYFRGNPFGKGGKRIPLGQEDLEANFGKWVLAKVGDRRIGRKPLRKEEDLGKEGQGFSGTGISEGGGKR